MQADRSVVVPVTFVGRVPVTVGVVTLVMFALSFPSWPRARTRDPLVGSLVSAGDAPKGPSLCAALETRESTRALTGAAWS